MTLRKLSTAEEEFLDAVAFYFAESPQSADRFIDEVEHCLDQIEEFPMRFPIFEDDVRNKLLDKFPYSILYRMDEDEIVILSYFHHKRAPGSWRENL